jgi:hypothetical protein
MRALPRQKMAERLFEDPGLNNEAERNGGLFEEIHHHRRITNKQSSVLATLTCDKTTSRTAPAKRFHPARRVVTFKPGQN